jgi:dTDP-4-amino-4,6-dideoxygalactose transaminase
MEVAVHAPQDASSPDSGAPGERVRIAAPTLPDFESLVPDLRDIWASGELTNGRFVGEFEAQVAKLMPDRHVVAVNSCTAGLMLALRALGVRGDVLVPSFTFMASAHAIVWSGSRPVFVDCDPQTLNVDVSDLERKITPGTVAIVAVYVGGNPPRLDELENFAAQHGLKLILDAAHALGSSFQGRPAGTFGDAEVFSLSPTKTITSCEGGLVSLRDPEVARRLRIGRNYGNPGNYDCEFVGLNARMSELHALIGLKSLPLLQRNIEERRRMVALYTHGLQRLRGLHIQHIVTGNFSSFKDFSLRVVETEFGTSRDALRGILEEHGIETRTYFDPPVHRMTAYAGVSQGRRENLSKTDLVARQILNLPLYVGLREEEIGRIVDLIESVGTREVARV